MEPLDQDAVRLAKAIRQHESGGNPNAKGKAGESGMYQFMPSTWKLYAKEILGDENAPMTPQNQNKIAYTKIKKWKDQGYNVGQVASMWNAGEQKPNAYKENWKKVDPITGDVIFDTPAYAEAIAKNYRQLKGTNVQAPRQTFQQAIPQAVEQGQQEQNISPGNTGIKGFLTGVGKGALGTIKGMGQLGEMILPPLGGKSVYSEDALKGTKMSKENLTAKTPSETIGKVAELGGELLLGGGLLKKGVTAAKGLISSKAISKTLSGPAIEQGIKRVGLNMNKFSKMANVDKIEALYEALKNASPIHREVIQQAIQSLKPIAIKEAGGVVAKTPGLIQKTITGGLKSAKDIALGALGWQGLSALKDKVFTGK